MKFSADELFKERAGAYFTELRKYTRYMLNDHLLFVLVFAAGALLYYYSGWVETVSGSFPAAAVMAAVLGGMAAWSPVYTYMKQPDTVYLLPLESELKPYMHKAVWSSFVAQSYMLVVLLAFAMPLYAKVEETGFGLFFGFLGAALAAKIWNLFCRLKALNVQSHDARTADAAVRLLLSIVFLWSVFSLAYLPASLTALFMLLWLFYMKRAGNRPLKWELLAALEQKRMAAFYRLANMFTDVPHLRGTVKRRAWLDGLLPEAGKGTYAYLLHRTFVRMSEYSGLYVRLSAIGAFIIAFSGLLPVQLLTALLFLYLTGFQLLPISVKHEHIMWTQLYPEGTEGKQRAVQQLLQKGLLIQSVLFGIAALTGGVMQGGIVGAASALFAFFFANVYAPPRLKKINRS